MDAVWDVESQLHGTGAPFGEEELACASWSLRAQITPEMGAYFLTLRLLNMGES